MINDRPIRKGKAFKQIEEKNYVLEVKDYDVTKIVIVFKGKECLIETRK